MSNRIKNFSFYFTIVFGVVFILSGFIYDDYRNKAHMKNAMENYVPFEVITKSEEEVVEDDYEFIDGRGEILYSPLGDSLTDGYYASEKSKRFTTVLSKKIEDEMGFDVDEDGIGNYGGMVSKGLDAAYLVKEKNPDIVSIGFGTNDSSPLNGDVTPEEFEEDMNTLVDLFLDEEDAPLIILMTTWNQGDKAIPFDDAIKRIGEERDLPVADISHIWKNSETKGPAGIDTEYGESDNWHPNDYGMDLIATEIFDIAAPYINEL